MRIFDEDHIAGVFVVGAMLVIILVVIFYGLGNLMSTDYDKYEVVYVDDIPCIVMDSGISCDWSKWQGE